MFFIGNGHRLSISHIGSCSLSRDLLLRDVLVVPQITINMFSISKQTHDLHVTILFNDISFVIQHKKTGIIVGRGLHSVGFSRLKIAYKWKTLNH